MTLVLNSKPEEAMSDRSFIGVLVVDDSAPWCRFLVNALQANLQILVVGIVSDGIDAVRKTQDLQPDLILLDIGLPELNGIEAAKLIRKHSADSKIIFVTAEADPEIARTALDSGGLGYVVKSDAGRELSSAVEAVMLGKRYISRTLSGHGPAESEEG